MIGQHIFRTGTHQPGLPLTRFTQPKRPVVGFKDQWHPVMGLAQISVGRSGDDGAGALAFTVRTPVLPDTTEGNRFVVAARDIPGQPLSLGGFGPFIEPCRQNQATPLAAGRAERGFLGQCFSAGIDQQRAIILRLVPMRQKPPTHRIKLAATFTGPHDMHLIGRAHIEIGSARKAVRRARRKQLRHCVVGKSYCKPSAHR